MLGDAIASNKNREGDQPIKWPISSHKTSVLQQANAAKKIAKQTQQSNPWQKLSCASVHSQPPPLISYLTLIVNHI